MRVPRAWTPLAAYTALLGLAEGIPLTLVQLAGRVAIFHVFWSSAQTKLASWPVTLQLFAFEYRVPLLRPASQPLWPPLRNSAGAS